MEVNFKREISPLKALPAKVSHLKRDGEYETALRLVLDEIKEQELVSSSPTGRSAAPWYYWEAAILCRTLKRYDDEIALIERFARQHTSARPGKIMDRLAKAKALAVKASKIEIAD